MKTFANWLLSPKPPLDIKFHPKLQEWHLPYWFLAENHPESPDFNPGQVRFYNHSHRNWTTVRAGSGLIEVDPYGVLTLPRWGVTLEVWLDTSENVITPGQFLRVKQTYLKAVAGVKTLNYFNGACLRTTCYPAGASQQDQIDLSIGFNGNTDANLKNWGILLVVRPYTHDGIRHLRYLEYQRGSLLINNQVLFNCDREPCLSCFSDANLGEVLEQYRRGEVNSRILCNDGYGTCLLGYSGLLTELKGIKLYIRSSTRRVDRFKQVLFSKRFFPKKGRELNRKKRPELSFKSNLNIDPLIHENLVHLGVFCGPQPEHYNVFQIMALNRWGQFSKSLAYLVNNLKYWRWHNNGATDRLEGGRLLTAAADYYRLSGDYNFIKEYWCILKRLGADLARYTANKEESSKEGYFADAFWDCAALSQLSYLARQMGETEQSHFFNEEYLCKWSDLNKKLHQITKAAGSKVIPWNLSGRKGGLVTVNLCAATPLGLFPIRDRYILETLALLGEQYLYQGGVVSPFDFKGIDLELTARLGQALIREGLDCSQVLELLIKTAGPTGTWPDRVHPKTGRGIGATGHDPLVTYQVLLLARNLFLMEEGGFLFLLPGLLANRFWLHPLITVRSLPSYFGKISMECRTVGNMVQIEYNPCYRIMPQKVLFRIDNTYRVLASDGGYCQEGTVLELDPGFHYLRLERVSSEAKLDNTF